MYKFDHDPHTYYVPGQPRMTHLDWTAQMNFVTHVLTCVAVIDFSEGGETNLDLRNLKVRSVTASDGQALEYFISETRPVLGECLTVTVPQDKSRIWILYSTDPTASALQWLDPQLTLGKVQPFLFSQAQALHAPSFIPCQDSPGIRFTFTASLTVPKALRALMAAGHVSREEQGDLATERWEMRQPIPAYLFALAVGDLTSADITSRCRVYAEPGLVDAAASEFADVGKFMEAAERLAGSFEWERFDILVLPPSFPYGGMENPRLAFVTPTLITGDGSMVYVIIHELSHSWTGNLVTNSSWQHFWLNEGFTTYFEQRINEELYGRDRMMLQAALLRTELDRDLKRFVNEGRPELTALASYLPANVDPDDIFSRVPYCKGAMFLMALEQAVGRPCFDTFILAYIQKFRFTSIDTANFLDFVTEQLPGALEWVGAWRWVYEAGIPDNAPIIHSPLISEVLLYAQRSEAPPKLVGDGWGGPQWTLFLESLPRPVAVTLVQSLDEDFGLSTTLSVEVLWAFLLLALESGYAQTNDKVEAFLSRVGRMRYVLPLFKAMANSPNGVAWARNVLETVKSGYHPITVLQSERVINEVAALQLTN